MDDFDNASALIDLCREVIDTVDNAPSATEDTDEARIYHLAMAAEMARRAIAFLHDHQYDYWDAKSELRAPVA